MMFKKVILASCIALSFNAWAVEDVVIAGIGYERISDGVCQAYATSYFSSSQAVVKRNVVFTDENGKTETCGVHRLRRDAFKGAETMTSFVVEEPQGEGFSRMVIFDNVFQNCTNLTTIELPSDLLTVVVNAFNGCDKLTTIVCRAEEVPSAFYSTADVADFDPHNHVVLYVPDASVGKYSALEKPDDKYEFWSSFDIRPLSQYDGGGTEPEKPGDMHGVELRLPLGTFTMLDAVEGDRIKLTADMDSQLVSVYFNDVDMIDRVEKGIFYLPSFSGTAVIRPVFELNSSLKVQSAEVSPVKVKLNGNQVDIEGIGLNDRVLVTTLDGRVVYEGRETSIQLASGVYILSTPNRSFKFAL